MVVPDFREFKGIYSDPYYLAHHGVLGQKWGVRRYQNADGSLTAQGRKRVQQLSDKKMKYTRKRDKAVRKAGRHVLTEFGVASRRRNTRRAFNLEAKITRMNKKLDSIGGLEESQKYIDNILATRNRKI